MIIADTHSKLLRGLAHASGRHFTGLAQAARHIRALNIIDSAMSTKLIRVDYAHNLSRHITLPSASKFVTELLDHVHRAPRAPHAQHDAVEQHSSTRPPTSASTAVGDTPSLHAAAASPASAAAVSSPRVDTCDDFFLVSPPPSDAGDTEELFPVSASSSGCQTIIHSQNSIVVDDPAHLVVTAMVNTCARISFDLQPRVDELARLSAAALAPPAPSTVAPAQPAAVERVLHDQEVPHDPSAGPSSSPSPMPCSRLAPPPLACLAAHALVRRAAHLSFGSGSSLAIMLSAISVGPCRFVFIDVNPDMILADIFFEVEHFITDNYVTDHRVSAQLITDDVDFHLLDTIIASSLDGTVIQVFMMRCIDSG